MTYSVFAIADELLRIAKTDGEALTPLQLMKLVYISYGWNFAINKNALFPERIEAWKYGPVIPDLYHATKRYGRDPIPLNLIDDECSVNEETSHFLQAVYAQYGHLNGLALSRLTHQAGSPWDQVYSDEQYNIEIPPVIIKQHYEESLNERAGNSRAAERH